MFTIYNNVVLKLKLVAKLVTLILPTEPEPQSRWSLKLFWKSWIELRKFGAVLTCGYRNLYVKSSN